MTTLTLDLPLRQIEPDLQYQVRRAGLDLAYVRELCASDPALWPPLLVTGPRNGKYVLVDGFHRLEAARQLGIGTLPCIVKPDATFDDAWRANLSHGLPLTLADRRAYALRLHAAEPDLSLREIGRRAGLSHNTVAALVRATDVPTGHIDQQHTTDGEDNETGDAPYNTPPVRNAPDPIDQLIRLLVRIEEQNAGTSLKFWLSRDEQRITAFVRAMRHRGVTRDTAQALHALGAVLTTASQRYVERFLHDT